MQRSEHSSTVGGNCVAVSKWSTCTGCSGVGASSSPQNPQRFNASSKSKRSKHGAAQGRHVLASEVRAAEPAAYVSLRTSCRAARYRRCKDHIQRGARSSLPLRRRIASSARSPLTSSIRTFSPLATSSLARGRAHWSPLGNSAPRTYAKRMRSKSSSKSCTQSSECGERSNVPSARMIANSMHSGGSSMCEPSEQRSTMRARSPSRASSNARARAHCTNLGSCVSKHRSRRSARSCSSILPPLSALSGGAPWNDNKFACSNATRARLRSGYSQRETQLTGLYLLRTGRH